MSFLPIRQNQFYPVTLTMNPENLLFGAMTLGRRWEYSRDRHPLLSSRSIDPTVLPNESLIRAILMLEKNQALSYQGMIIAAHLSDYGINFTLGKDFNSSLDALRNVPYEGPLDRVESLQYIIDHNADQIIRDLELMMTTDRIPGRPISVRSVIDATVNLKDVVIDDRQGPVYIGPDVHIMAGARILGPVVILDGAMVKMGAELYPGTVVGPHSVVSGEIKNSIIHEYSAKGHAGYLGDSILGRWNNFGAGTTVSNVSNTFSRVTIKDWNTDDPIEYTSIKRGVMTGDFVKLGIQSRVYRGTAIGSFSSIATYQAIQGNIPPLYWWSDDKKTGYQPDVLRVHCQNQMALRGAEWTREWEDALSFILSANVDPKIKSRK